MGSTMARPGYGVNIVFLLVERLEILKATLGELS